MADDDTVSVPGGARGQRVLVVGQLDGYANGVRPREIARFLLSRGHDVRLVDTYYLSRASSASRALRRLPGPTPAQMSLYAVEHGAAALGRYGGRLGRRLSGPLLFWEATLRGRLLRSQLPMDEADLVIVETPTDGLALAGTGRATRWYDGPTPWADELYLEGRLTDRQHLRARERERCLLDSADVLSFHWHSYGEYARDIYGIRARNLVTLDWGCSPVREEMRAQFGAPLRVVYLGSLSSRFIDLPLLARLSASYPHVDVYGGPEPDPALGLRYRGWAPPETLSQYQLGLITCTADELRRRGFSAKHLEYFAHGLPVLVPRWRTDQSLAEGSLPYDEETFVSVVRSMSDEAAWRRMADEAYAQAGRYAWERTLTPLDDVLRELPGRT